jgi:hypothetical protein
MNFSRGLGNCSITRGTVSVQVVLQILENGNCATSCGTIRKIISKPFVKQNIFCERLRFTRVRAGIVLTTYAHLTGVVAKPAPTGEHGAFCNSPVGATLAVALPHNKNSHFPRENRTDFFKLNTAQLVRKIEIPRKTMSASIKWSLPCLPSAAPRLEQIKKPAISIGSRKSSKTEEFMAQINQYERQAMRFLRFLGLTVERFPGKDSTRNRQTVDFKVSSSSGYFFYCEQKTINDPPFSGMYPQKAQDKIKHKLVDAHSQFLSVNPNRLVPNVLLWRSTNPQFDYHHLIDLLNGGNPLTPKVDYSLYQRRARRFLAIIDAHVWLHSFGPPKVIFTTENSFFKTRLQRIFRDELSEQWGLQNMEPLEEE